MKLPSRNRNWLKEVKKAYKDALKIQHRLGTNASEIYKLAPELAAKNRTIKSKATIEAMLDRAIKDVEYDKQIEPEEDEGELFHFVFSYIMSHSTAGLIEELEADKIMDYVNAEWNLFPDD